MARMRRIQESEQPDSSIETELDAAAEEQGQPQGFFQIAAALSEGDWERARIYVYRLSPKIDSGGKAYISKFDRPIDEGELLGSFGSGRYLLILNDGNGRVLAKNTVVVNSPDSPPKVRLEQVLDLPENATWIAWIKEAGAKSKRDENPGISAAAQEANSKEAEILRLLIAQQQAQQQRPALDSQVMELFKTATSERDALAGKLAEVANKQGPTGPDPLAMVEKVLNLGRELQPPPPPPAADPMAMVREVLTTVTALQKASTPLPPPPQKSFLEGVREITEAITAMRQLQEPAEASIPKPDSGGSAMWAQIAAALAPALAPLTQVLAMRLMASAQTPQPVMSSPQLSPPAVAPTPTAQQPQPPPTESQAAAPLEPTIEESALQFMRAIEIPLLRFLDGNRTGDEFADLMIESYGRSVYDNVCQGGPDMLLAGLMSHPPIRNVLQSNPTRAQRFIEDFINHDSIVADEEEPPTELKAGTRKAAAAA